MEKIKFRSQYDPVILEESDSGSPFMDQLDYEVKEGFDLPVPFVKGQINFYELIQSSKASTDIASILARAKQDPSVLQVSEGFYGDITQTPNSLMEAAALGTATKESFDNLSDDVKALFGNDYNTFYQMVLSNVVDKVISDQVQLKAKEKEGEDNA